MTAALRNTGARVGLGLLLIVGFPCPIMKAAPSDADGQVETPAGQDAAGKPQQQPTNDNPDPFADLTSPAKPQSPAAPVGGSWRRRLFTENFGFRKEVMSQFDASEHGQVMAAMEMKKRHYASYSVMKSRAPDGKARR